MTAIAKQLERMVAKQKLSETEKTETLDRIRGVVPLEEIKGCERVIECAPEDLDLKRELLQRSTRSSRTKRSSRPTPRVSRSPSWRRI